MENKVKVWLARDKDGSIFMHNNKPKKYSIDSIWMSDYFVKLNKEEFPSVKWEDDEPTEAYITLANEPQPKQDIDWEQRRYEIVKDIMPVIYQRFADRELKYDQIVKKEYAVDYAIEIVDMLIKKLKGQGK